MIIVALLMVATAAFGLGLLTGAMLAMAHDAAAGDDE